MERDAIWRGNGRISYETVFTVGARSDIGTVQSAWKKISIGSDCKLGNDITLQSATVGNHVTIGDGATLYEMEIKDNVIIGKNFRAVSHSKVFSGVRIGDKVHMGVDAHIYDGFSIGDNCCIGDSARVRQNMPDRSYMNSDGILHLAAPGKVIGRPKGRCEEFDVPTQ